MMAQTLNRFEWIKAVMQVETLSATTRLVASALAIQFANDKTGQINPSQETITDYLKVHPDTVKRALRELRKAGWLTSLSDGGRGKSPKLRLLSPSTTLPFRPSKGGEFGFCCKYFLGRILFRKNPILKRLLAWFAFFPFEIAIRLTETVA